jgi:hypothetical protein
LAAATKLSVRLEQLLQRAHRPFAAADELAIRTKVKAGVFDPSNGESSMSMLLHSQCMPSKPALGRVAASWYFLAEGHFLVIVAGLQDADNNVPDLDG